MNILVANDDGIQAQGIRELVKALSAKATVYVCAPESQRSATGHGITVSKPITVETAEVDGAEKAWQISGTPADCVKMGVYFLQQEGIKVDMVFSGINHGGNLGTDTLYSGTVSAAMEGCLCGIRSVAVSVNSHGATHFDYACELALEAMEKAYDVMSADTVININVPDLPKEEVKGIRYATLGRREYDEVFERVETEDGKLAYDYSGEPVVYTDLPDTIDVIAMQDGYATITPLHHDLTDYKMVDEIRKWRIGE